MSRPTPRAVVPAVLVALSLSAGCSVLGGGSPSSSATASTGPASALATDPASPPASQPTRQTRARHAVDGIEVVDATNSKLYLVASDGHGTCLCSRSLGRTFLEADLPVLVSVTYAAPPADVSTVDLLVPGFGTVKGVPVQ